MKNTSIVLIDWSADDTSDWEQLTNEEINTTTGVSCYESRLHYRKTLIVASNNTNNQLVLNSGGSNNMYGFDITFIPNDFPNDKEKSFFGFRNMIVHYYYKDVTLLRSFYQETYYKYINLYDSYHENILTNNYNSFGNWSDDYNVTLYWKSYDSGSDNKNYRRLNGSVCSIDDSSDGEYNCYHGWFSGPQLSIYRQFNFDFVGNRLVTISFRVWLGCTPNADDSLIVCFFCF